MLGLMQQTPLLVSSILDHALRWHGEQEIVGLALDGSPHRQSFAVTAERSAQLAHALTDLGIQAGDRVGIIGWNSHRHVELWYALSGIGAIAHDINPRLSPEQITFIVNDAGDTAMFCDPAFIPLVDAVRPGLTCVETYVAMSERSDVPAEAKSYLCFEDVLDGQPTQYAWPQFDENTANALCYTSGTTGNPKGVLYSHRSNVLHAMALCGKDAVSIGARDAVLPAAPMFHANGWGMPYAALMQGAKLVFSGRLNDGPNLHQLIRSEGVTVVLGVPTIALALLKHAAETGETWPSLERFVIAGSAAPLSMIEAFDAHGVEVIHCWGMTETSPIGTSSVENLAVSSRTDRERLLSKLKQGRPVFGVDIKIVDEDENTLLHDGDAMGDLRVRGPWVLERYFGSEKSAIDDDGWFDTGDKATIDPQGYMQITDRTKDLIKSGGEWISSVDLENIAASHVEIEQAAVVGVAHPKWDERPILVAVLAAGSRATKQDIHGYLQDNVPKLWVPDEIIFVDALPLGATGKVQKAELRREYTDILTR